MQCVPHTQNNTEHQQQQKQHQNVWAVVVLAHQLVNYHLWHRWSIPPTTLRRTRARARAQPTDAWYNINYTHTGIRSPPPSSSPPPMSTVFPSHRTIDSVTKSHMWVFYNTPILHTCMAHWILPVPAIWNYIILFFSFQILTFEHRKNGFCSSTQTWVSQ